MLIAAIFFVFGLVVGMPLAFVVLLIYAFGDQIKRPWAR